MIALDLFVRTFAFSQLALIALLSLLAHRRDRNFQLLIGLCISESAYLFIYPLWIAGDRGWLLWSLAVISSANALFLFLLSAKLFTRLWSLKTEKTLAMTYILISAGAHLEILPPVVVDTLGLRIMVVAGGCLALLALAAILKNWSVDLVESRRRLRLVFFVLMIGGWGLWVVLVMAGVNWYSGDPFALAECLWIALIALMFNLTHWRGRPDSIWLDLQPKLQGVYRDEKMDELTQLIDQRRIYREEGMTIAGMARALGTGEQRLRQIINQQLGYENFNDFLNHHRVKDAAQLLIEGENKILDIAYEVGFLSLATFNRAFKKEFAMTPSEYRSGPRDESAVMNA